MKMNKVVLLAGLLLATSAGAAGPSKTAGDGKVDASAALARLKGLAGEWNVESARGKGHSQFQVIAGGSVVLERFSERSGNAYRVSSRWRRAGVDALLHGGKRAAPGGGAI